MILQRCDMVLTNLQELKRLFRRRGFHACSSADAAPVRSRGEKPQLPNQPNQRSSSVINTRMNDRPDDGIGVCFAF